MKGPIRQKEGRRNIMEKRRVVKKKKKKEWNTVERAIKTETNTRTEQKGVTSSVGL